ncbi:MAG: cell division protein FtsA, partial [Syntrophales bacterium]|nr:cell division protein FtsA [Syntrophales bacterium]
MRKKSNIIVGLDIGTFKTCAVVGEVTDLGVDIVGLGYQPSEGMRRGAVVNIESMVEAVRGAVEEANKMSGYDIRSVCLGIGGTHIKSENSTGLVTIAGREVTEDDVQRALEQARAIPLPLEREIIHTLPQ